MNSAIVLMAKNPIAGQVKTRLAKDLGEERAVEIYLELLAHTTAVMSEISTADHIIYHSPQLISHADWAAASFNHKLQKEGHLGERMKAAFQDELTGHGKVIVIGADCMRLEKEHIIKALHTLDHVDVVLGPSTDGGYYLIGLSALQPILFQNINWGTDLVFEQTLDKIGEQGLSMALLEELYDIDYKEDWERWKNEAPK